MCDDVSVGTRNWRRIRSHIQGATRNLVEAPSFALSPRAIFILFPNQALFRLFITETMREVISVHVGQAGVQIGNACCKSSRLIVHSTS